VTRFQKIALLWQARNAAADPAFKQIWSQKAKELAELTKGEESHG